LARGVEGYGQRYPVASFWSSSIHSKDVILVGPLNSLVAPDEVGAILDREQRGFDPRTVMGSRTQFKKTQLFASLLSANIKVETKLNLQQFCWWSVQAMASF